MLFDVEDQQFNVFLSGFEVLDQLVCNLGLVMEFFHLVVMVEGFDLAKEDMRLVQHPYVVDLIQFKYLKELQFLRTNDALLEILVVFGIDLC